MPVFNRLFHTLSTGSVGGEVTSLKWLGFFVVKNFLALRWPPIYGFRCIYTGFLFALAAACSEVGGRLMLASNPRVAQQDLHSAWGRAISPLTMLEQHLY